MYSLLNAIIYFQNSNSVAKVILFYEALV